MNEWYESNMVWLSGWCSCILHTVLGVLISVLFCQGKASLPLFAADLADCSNCGCMSAFLRNVQSQPNLWKVSLWVSLCPFAFDNAKSTQQCPDWYKQVEILKSLGSAARWRIHDVAFGRSFWSNYTLHKPLCKISLPGNQLITFTCYLPFTPI